MEVETFQTEIRAEDWFVSLCAWSRVAESEHAMTRRATNTRFGSLCREERSGNYVVTSGVYVSVRAGGVRGGGERGSGRRNRKW